LTKPQGKIIKYGLNKKMASLWLSGQTLTTYSALNFVKVLRENPKNYLLEIKKGASFGMTQKLDQGTLTNRQPLTANSQPLLKHRTNRCAFFSLFTRTD
jgi:hypothetical protein